MKRLPLALLTVGLLAAPAAAQGQDPIARISARYAEIEHALAGLTHRQLDLAGMSAEGGTLDVYGPASRPRKLVATYYGETGHTTESYYYDGGRLIFVFRVEERYDRPLSGRVSFREENRFYFYRDTLIRWIDASGARVPPTSAEALQRAAELSAGSTDLLRRAAGG